MLSSFVKQLYRQKRKGGCSGFLVEIGGLKADFWLLFFFMHGKGQVQIYSTTWINALRLYTHILRAKNDSLSQVLRAKRVLLSLPRRKKKLSPPPSLQALRDVRPRLCEAPPVHPAQQELRAETQVLLRPDHLQVQHIRTELQVSERVSDCCQARRPKSVSREVVCVCVWVCVTSPDVTSQTWGVVLWR